MNISVLAILIGLVGVSVGGTYHAYAQGQGPGGPTSSGKAEQGAPGRGISGQDTMGVGLIVPMPDAARGRRLFASKGCVVCHSVNGLGGRDGSPLDASLMPLPMNPIEFAAKMWRGAEAMVALQRDELGEVIELSGQELTDIIGFVHNLEEQKRFTRADVPRRILNLMTDMKEDKPR